MKFSGESLLAAERGEVFRALNDPGVLVAAIPGCQRLEALGADTYTMTVAAGVGSIKGVYDGEVRLTDHLEPLSFRMHARGAGAPGTVGASVQVVLEEHPEGGTRLSYDADATVGGTIGGVGQRMLTGVSRRMAEEFFRNVDTVLAAGPVPASAAPAAAVSAVEPGAVFTPPQPPTAAGRTPAGFALGVVTGAGAALVGALVGAWISRRSRGGSR
ncbi:SRPBCC family protein [Nocardioides mesophilus]|uniref:Carbon monoxide dehydrogenase subunit G n=1 Tax=Nocardioides mesophilus TaxID=433659 RepID=A0A7G9RAF8_9ACTN|nr:carbon monoxide dehydrogenase subunit G [Nocardioides mesophilus]QNN52583.1 carbon monoxide dehydrogenase subunit G [Nocardioides mesophilus]